MSISSSTKNHHMRLKLLLREDLDPGCIPLGAVLALVSIGEFDALDFYLNSLLDRGLHPSDIHEILLQSHLFAGFPRAITGLEIFVRSLRNHGLDLKEFRNMEGHKREKRRHRGRKLFEKVYRNNAKAVLKSLRSLYPRYDRWVLEDAYGRVLSRPFLPGKVRELCAVAALTVTGGPRQLRSHIMGAVNMGAHAGEVERVIRSMDALVSSKKIDDALEILAELDLK